ncbi:ABC transporter ATP-binding protein [Enterococcus quebecensis]|uniref:ABC transporter ATP-binding protein n=1 Tax=Enterococcus quebecensis TaxID=903983 RepID=UPI0009F5C937|nr:ABC transporter ATP-binding protein [Enterococcus quebecensis]
MGYLEIEDLSFQYAGSEKKVLNNVSFSVNQGDFILICGASGSGKSTLLKMLKPQLTPSGTKIGEIYLNKENLSTIPDVFSASKIGYVMQNPENQIVTDKGWHELAFGLENIGLTPSEIKNRIAEMVNFLGIPELVEAQTKDLSGGQKQLLNLASVLVMRPDVLILDEPTTQLDPIAAQNFVDILVRLNREMGLTIVLAEHSLESVFSLVSKVVLLDKGQVIFSEEPANISQGIQSSKLDLTRFILSLPSAVQIYLESGQSGKTPITVIDGKRFLAQHFSSRRDKQNKNKIQQVKNNQNTSVQLKNCWFRYEKNSRDILAGIDFDLYEGEIFSLVGGNGTGKTTLLKVIAGIQKCYLGKVTLFNQPIKKMQQLIGYLPQNPQTMFIRDSVVDDYKNYLLNQKVDEQEQQKLIEKITDALDIKEILTEHPLDLSGGECQRAALGKLLLADPQVLLLDEPTKGIDNYGKKELIRLLKKLSLEGKTILVVTHDLDFSAELSDRCGLFFQNDVLTTGIPNEFFSHQTFYTTAASRISRETFSELVTTDQVIAAYIEAKGVADE